MIRTIMLLEDDVDNAFLMSYVLSEAGYKVVTGNVAHFRDDIIAHSPELVFIDYRLGHILGSEITARIKSDQQLKHIVVVLASAMNNLQQLADECGANDILAKPFDLEDLTRLAAKWDEELSGKS